MSVKGNREETVWDKFSVIHQDRSRPSGRKEDQEQGLHQDQEKSKLRKGEGECCDQYVLCMEEEVVAEGFPPTSIGGCHE